jgi:beta-glucosidase
MPWLDRTEAVLEAWYPGRGGAEAIADLLFGDADPSGHLPITFPAAEPPEPVAGFDGDLTRPFDVTYAEGAAIGYRGTIKPLFPFGFGLSYTRVGVSFATAAGGATATADVTLSNGGERAGRGLAQLYLLSGPNGPEKRLIGWRKLDLAPGESRTVSLAADPRLLADFDPAARLWRIRPGAYEIGVGLSSEDIVERRIVQLDGRTLLP